MSSGSEDGLLAGSHSNDDRAPRIVLAEDDRDARVTLAEDLRRHGFEVDTASSGDELIALLASDETNQCKPDAIVTDFVMPGFTGLEILEGLAEAGWTTPLIVITAFGGQGVAPRAQALGAVAVFEKPFDVMDLVESLRAVVGAKKHS